MRATGRPRLTVLSGAGISAASGVKTFRDHGGLWEDHSLEDVATPQGYAGDPELVNAFYNARRRQLQEVSPNDAHLVLAQAEQFADVYVVTQNVDDLHERAGSSQVLHLHGELKKVRSVRDDNYVLDWDGDLTADDRDTNGHPLRPHIVWFGEDVPLLTRAAAIVAESDFVLIVGTSLQVYPAAMLLTLAPRDCPVTYVDLDPAVSPELGRRANVRTVAAPASVGVPAYVRWLGAELR